MDGVADPPSRAGRYSRAFAGGATFMSSSKAGVAVGALPETARDTWPAEVVWASPSAAHLLATLQQLEERLSRAPECRCAASQRRSVG